MLKWKIADSASISKTISESDVYLFAGITGDFNPAHIIQSTLKRVYLEKGLYMVFW